MFQTYFLHFIFNPKSKIEKKKKFVNRYAHFTRKNDVFCGYWSLLCLWHILLSTLVQTDAFFIIPPDDDLLGMEKKECPGEVLVPKWVQQKNKKNQFIVLIFTGKIQKNIFTISRLIWPEKRRDSNFPAEAPPMARAAPPRHPWPSNYH